MLEFFTGWGRWSVTGLRVSLLVILADISPIFTFCSGQFIASFIYLSKMLYVMLSIGKRQSISITNKKIETTMKRKQIEYEYFHYEQKQSYDHSVTAQSFILNFFTFEETLCNRHTSSGGKDICLSMKEGHTRIINFHQFSVIQDSI